MSPETMTAIVVASPDGAFESAVLPRPHPQRGELLVHIRAIGVNPLDTKIRAGKAAHARHPLPAVLGIDLAGVVDAVGEGVTGFVPGDAVYGMAGGVGGIQGSLAEYAAVDAALLAHKPANLSMRDAAALPLAFITAWEGLVDRAKIRAGQRLLVLGAGGVGQAAIQLGRALGAEVWAVASARKADLIRALGATPIDRNQSVSDYVAQHSGSRGFDLVYDTVGGASLDAAFEAVSRSGHVVSCLGWGEHALAPLSFRAATYSGVFTLLPLLTGEGRAHHGAILAEAAKLAEAGKLAPRLDPRRFSFASVEEAYAAVAGNQSDGKIVIDAP